ncbi:hypothetical protein AWC38_SpisGene2315 [Stylophora pistillata]|uniref:Uncharacterized protein n=1 Tax=Stylophora pistillata TaxID=50429 RepID=A0A2B4SWC9_STYPI|nr:hypothetical protein AWC38_SpisGene2315 [Stylophora pistillata]
MEIKMKNAKQAKRFSFSTMFLLLIIVAAVTAKATQKDSFHQIDTAIEENAAAKKQARGWRVCHSGKCYNSRGRKRGMKRIKPQFQQELQDFEITNKDDFDIPAAETRTLKSWKDDFQS